MKTILLKIHVFRFVFLKFLPMQYHWLYFVHIFFTLAMEMRTTTMKMRESIKAFWQWICSVHIGFKRNRCWNENRIFFLWTILVISKVKSNRRNKKRASRICNTMVLIGVWENQQNPAVLKWMECIIFVYFIHAFTTLYQMMKMALAVVFLFIVLTTTADK